MTLLIDKSDTDNNTRFTVECSKIQYKCFQFMLTVNITFLLPSGETPLIKIILSHFDSFLNKFQIHLIEVNNGLVTHFSFHLFKNQSAALLKFQSQFPLLSLKYGLK